MPAKDKFHDAVKNALTKDGWTITHDPFPLKYGFDQVFIDVAAEKIIVAQKKDEKIAVEIKTFGGKSEIQDLHNAVGQIMVYRSALKRTEKERELFLAVTEDVFNDIFEDSLGKAVLEDYSLKVLIFNAQKEEIVRWEK